MSHLSKLVRRLSELQERAAGRTTRDRLENETQMRRIAPLRARFEEAREAWMTGVVLPRLQALAGMLPHGGRVEHRSGAVEAVMKCDWSNEAGFSSSLSVSIAPCPEFENALVHVRPLFIPTLADNPPASSREFDIAALTPDALSEFMDDAIVAFAEAYFEAREPTSVYQRECFSVDPVCGMTVHHASAAVVLRHEDHSYYFCAVSCADRFRADPERYTHVPSKMGGTP